MKKVLFILGELNDDDIDWMITTGHREELTAGTVLIEEEKAIDALYILLDGVLSVSISVLGGKEIARLSSGEVVGEMSFIDASLPSATVKAVTPVLVLSLPRRQLSDKLDRDVGFAYRFHRAIAVLLSQRLRGTVSLLGYGENLQMASNGSYQIRDPILSHNMDIAGARFDWLLRRLREG